MCPDGLQPYRRPTDGNLQYCDPFLTVPGASQICPATHQCVVALGNPGRFTHLLRSDEERTHFRYICCPRSVAIAQSIEQSNYCPAGVVSNNQLCLINTPKACPEQFVRSFIFKNTHIAQNELSAEQVRLATDRSLLFRFALLSCRAKVAYENSKAITNHYRPLTLTNSVQPYICGAQIRDFTCPNGYFCSDSTLATVQVNKRQSR